MNRRARRRRHRVPTDIQKRCPAWVGWRRHRFGIRHGHPWRSWPLERISALEAASVDVAPRYQEAAPSRAYRERLRAKRKAAELRAQLRDVQVALAGWWAP